MSRKNPKRRTDAQLHAALRRDEELAALRDGRKPGRGGYHRNKKAYDRKRDRRQAVRDAY